MNEPKRIQWILKCLAFPEVELNDWEQQFYEDIEKRFNTRGTLTDNQYDKLEEIFERHQ